jgi:DNA topoisomerase-2
MADRCFPSPSLRQGGKDHAAARYIFTDVPRINRAVFHPSDDALLDYLLDDNDRIEPQWYIPVLPMILVNGADGIGTGASPLPGRRNLEPDADARRANL